MLRRERAYAKTIRHFAGSRIERISVNETLHEAIRFSVVKDGETAYLSPLDLREDELLVLMGDAIAARVFPSAFVGELHEMLEGIRMSTSVPATTPVDDHEQGYRRGVEHGAGQVMDAVKGLLTPQQNQQLNDWLEQKVIPWKKSHAERPMKPIPNAPQVT